MLQKYVAILLRQQRKIMFHLKLDTSDVLWFLPLTVNYCAGFKRNQKEKQEEIL